MSNIEPTIVLLNFDDGSVGRMQIFLNKPTDYQIQLEIQRSVFSPSVGRPHAWRRVTMDYFPEDNTFRNAWVDNQELVHVDMPKAIEVAKDRLREKRVPLLQQLDVEYLRALEQKDDKTIAKITLEKQRLRDITKQPKLLNAGTPEELKEIINAE